ncbi:MICOS complex subunit mic25a [Orchesella cincta]|uniref:MICOS complex subunit mic25a n=1 Tax=Orchesella cincta TaxID=48709 RepID=A0A1D2MWK9_ORCCI|nr:MICOS complex subunit mic25a [Orchesella cincta]
MGSGQSKKNKEIEVIPPPKPKLPVPASGDIAITQQVVDRFQYQAMSKYQRMEVDKDKKKEVVTVLTRSEVETVGGLLDDKKRELDGGRGDGVHVGGVGVLQKEKVGVTESCKCKSDSNISQQKVSSEDKRIQTENVQTSSGYYDGMDKLTNFFIHDKDKPRRDVEGGDEVLKKDLDPETSHSYFIREPSHPMSPKYEEVDETRIGSMFPKRSEKLLDEEAMIGRTPPSRRFKGVRVSRSILPIVIDHDEEGLTTVETLTAWKMKAKMEKEIFKHNQHWHQELEKITAKMENETRIHANDFEKRLEQFKVQNPEEATPFTGPVCKALPPQIGKCYEENPNQILKCSELVREFAECTNTTGTHKHSTSGRVK